MSSPVLIVKSAPSLSRATAVSPIRTVSARYMLPKLSKGTGGNRTMTFGDGVVEWCVALVISGIQGALVLEQK